MVGAVGRAVGDAMRLRQTEYARRIRPRADTAAEMPDLLERRIDPVALHPFVADHVRDGLVEIRKGLDRNGSGGDSERPWVEAKGKRAENGRQRVRHASTSRDRNAPPPCRKPSRVRPDAAFCGAIPSERRPHPPTWVVGSAAAVVSRSIIGDPARRRPERPRLRSPWRRLSLRYPREDRHRARVRLAR